MRGAFALLLLGFCGGCLHRNPLYCDTNEDCADGVCDVEGTTEESGGHGHTCVSSLEDASVPDAASPDGTPGMVTVSAGPFMMGCAPGEAYCRRDESPYHAVTLPTFEIDRTEVTQQDYLECIDSGACASINTDRFYNPSTMPLFPIIYVSWNDAASYCAWRGRRLPTEAEWKKAARGTDERIYPWGSTTVDCDHANTEGCAGNVIDDVEHRPQGASPYGAVDMAGNVWEWVSDWYSPSYYLTSPSENPEGPQFGTEKVLRGGGAYSDAPAVRVSNRGHAPPEAWDLTIGFRCARTP